MIDARRIAFTYPAQINHNFDEVSPQAQSLWLLYLLEDFALGEITEAELDRLIDETLPR